MTKLPALLPVGRVHVDVDRTNSLAALTSEIVSAFVSNNSIAASEIPALIYEVHAALARRTTEEGGIGFEVIARRQGQLQLTRICRVRRRLIAVVIGNGTMRQARDVRAQILIGHAIGENLRVAAS